MRSVTYEMRDGKALYGGRTLAEWVPEVVDAVVRACDPEEVLLFGSVARGDDGPDSDIDLMVVCSSIDYTKRHELVVCPPNDARFTRPAPGEQRARGAPSR